MKPLLVLLLLLVPALALTAQVGHREITIPVRDGQALAADLYSTDTTARRPTVLVQTPYNKNLYRIGMSLPPEAGGRSLPWDTAHYNVVVVDWRGYYGSRGAAVDGYDRGLDGYDAVEWIAAQGWSDRKIGTWGPSALGLIQYQTARHRPPHLVCAVPLVKDFKTKYTDYFYGGEYRKEHVETLAAIGFVSPSTILERPTLDNLWRIVERNGDIAEQIAIPMLVIGGWFDHYPDAVLRSFEDLRTMSDRLVRDRHRLLMGPWLHSSVGDVEQGALSFPNAAALPDSVTMAFFDHHLRGLDNAYESMPVTTYYQMGRDEWRSTTDWWRKVDAGDTLYLFMHRGGLLSRDRGIEESAGSFTYDPRDPTPAVGGSRFPRPGTSVPLGPQDQRAAVESRGDVVIFETPELTEDLDVVGAPRFVFGVRSSTPDADVVVRLTDVHPDGRSMLVTQGVQRLRFRRGLEPRDTAAMPIGTPQQGSVMLQNIAMTWRRGHRLRLVISGAAYPHFERNLNTGGPLYGGTDTAVTTIEIIGSGAYTSVLELPFEQRPSGVDEAAGRTMLEGIAGPMRGAVPVRFALDVRADVSIALHDLVGREVLRLVDGTLDAGEHRAIIDADALPHGAYILSMRIGAQRESRVVVR